jgi:hypothetical protein
MCTIGTATTAGISNHVLFSVLPSYFRLFSINYCGSSLKSQSHMGLSSSVRQMLLGHVVTRMTICRHRKAFTSNYHLTLSCATTRLVTINFTALATRSSCISGVSPVRLQSRGNTRRAFQLVSLSDKHSHSLKNEIPLSPPIQIHPRLCERSIINSGAHPGTYPASLFRRVGQLPRQQGPQNYITTSTSNTEAVEHGEFLQTRYIWPLSNMVCRSIKKHQNIFMSRERTQVIPICNAVQVLIQSPPCSL